MYICSGGTAHVKTRLLKGRPVKILIKLFPSSFETIQILGHKKYKIFAVSSDAFQTPPALSFFKIKCFKYLCGWTGLQRATLWSAVSLITLPHFPSRALAVSSHLQHGLDLQRLHLQHLTIQLHHAKAPLLLGYPSSKTNVIKS